MILYEAVNGYTGESYTRVYVWAEDAVQAHALAEQAYKQDAERHNKFNYRIAADYWMDFELVPLFSSDDAPFATAVSDDGWDRERATS